MKFSCHLNFANFKNCEIKVTPMISVMNIPWRENLVTHLVNNQERTSLLPLSVLPNLCKPVSSEVNIENVNVQLKISFLKLIWEVWLVHIAKEVNGVLLEKMKLK